VGTHRTSFRFPKKSHRRRLHALTSPLEQPLTDENHLVYTPLPYPLSMPATQEQGKSFEVRALEQTDISITVQVGR